VRVKALDALTRARLGALLAVARACAPGPDPAAGLRDALALLISARTFARAVVCANGAIGRARVTPPHPTPADHARAFALGRARGETWAPALEALASDLCEGGAYYWQWSGVLSVALDNDADALVGQVREGRVEPSGEYARGVRLLSAAVREVRGELGALQVPPGPRGDQPPETGPP
jgi:hypothetical protein